MKEAYDYNSRYAIKAMIVNSNKNFGGLRFEVLERDKYKCTMCGVDNENHLKKYNKSLTVHHKDENKKNSTLENMITVCSHCHWVIHLKDKTKVEKNKNRFKMLSLRKNGYTYQRIADKFNVSRQRVHQIIEKLTSV